MSKYNVTITETLSKTFEVEANSVEEAKEKIEDRYYEAKDDSFVLGADDLSGFNIDAELKPSPMKLRIYQVNTDRDNDRIAFMGYDSLERFQGTKDINSSVYDKVYDGELNLESLEDVYAEFNFTHPDGYTGRSLSVSDIVEIVSSDNQSPGFYFCDTVGFKKVDFDPSKVPETNKPKTMKVVLLEPNKFAKAAEIGTELSDLQKVVGGYIEAAYFFNEDVCLICNEEGKIRGLPLNRGVYDEDKKLVDIIAGTAFICDCSGENFGSLNDEQLKKYTKQFRNPERFIKLNGEVKGIPFKPEKDRDR